MQVGVLAIAVLLVAVGGVRAATIRGTAGTDTLRGTPTADKLYGRGGNDRLYGRGGNDLLVGGAGNDLLVGGPGADRLSCGPGRDVAVADTKDKVGTDCEVVKGISASPRPAPPAPPTPPPPAPPAPPAPAPQPVGPLLSFFLGPFELPADSPFHVGAGWGLDPKTEAVEKYGFKLQVDGVYRSEDFVQQTVSADGTIGKVWVFNFPNGLLAGTHVFVGHYLAPCSGVPGCTNSDPNAVVEQDVRTLTVVFS